MVQHGPVGLLEVDIALRRAREHARLDAPLAHELVNGPKDGVVYDARLSHSEADRLEGTLTFRLPDGRVLQGKLVLTRKR